MSERISGFRAALSAGLAALTALWGWYGWLVLLWAALMGLDVLTGMARAAKGGVWSSSAAREGLWHKAGAMAAVLVACLLDLTLSQVAAALPGVGLPVGELALLGPTTVVWYILTECGSIVENAGALGAPVPGWLARRLERLRDRVDREKEDEEV